MGSKKILKKHKEIKAEQEETKDDNIEEQLLNAQVNQAGMGMMSSQERADANIRSQDLAKAMAKEMKRKMF